MITQASNGIAVALYLSVGIYLANQLIRQQPANRIWLLGPLALALVFHGFGVYSLTYWQGALHLGLFKISSLIFWVINLVVLVSSLKKPLENLFLFLCPLSVISVALATFFSTTTSPKPLDYGMASHVLLSIIAYSLLTIATLQALLLAYQNYQLRHKHPLGVVKLLPPLQTMEALLFEMLWAGQICLSLAIVSGFLYLDDLFAQHVVHKTALSIFAWLVYCVLLWGRHAKGWRGNTAIRWTLGGFASLMLAFFGSKLVLEIILQRV